MNFGESLVGQINEYVRQKVSAFLEKFVSHIPPEKSVALQNSIWLDNIFKHVKTSSKQESFINSLIGAIPKPRSIMLNGKEVKRFVDGKEKCKKVILNQFLISSLYLTEPKIVLQAYDTFQYIPIVESLKMILKNPDNRLALTEKESFNERSGVYQSFIDGKQYKNSDYFKAYPNALRIIIYEDDVEPCNALSSRAGNNKISALYFKIQNLPRRFNASTKSVFPLIYAKSIDTKKHGYNKILLPLVEDLKKLEKGVTIYINNQNITIRGAVIVVAGDTLAIHELFGLLGPSARLFCRECTITRNNFLNDHFDSQYHLRDRAWYEDNLAQVQKKNISSKDCGLKTTGCILNDLQHFHLTNNHCFDVMHDLAEGVIPVTLQLVLAHYYRDKQLGFSIDFINHRLKSFNYGYRDSKNKPSANITAPMLLVPSKHRMRQTASQYLLLLRAFPFLFMHKVPRGCEYLDLISVLINASGYLFQRQFQITI